MLAKTLLFVKEDLIHKAVGWMLREVGKRDLTKEKSFLNRHHHQMPRIMLRYAIEHFPEKTRKKYLTSQQRIFQ
jgi:Predicted DNA alkylation repair enzyme